MKKLFFIKKKGFTLIELLAVIVILAIILLVVMPIVLNVINDAKKGAFESSTRGLIKTAENECLSKIMTSDGIETIYSFNNGVQTVEPSGEALLKFSGSSPKEGYILVDEDCKVEFKLSDGVWYAEKDIDNKEIVIEEYEDQELTPGEAVAELPDTDDITYINNPEEPDYPENATPCLIEGNEFTHITDKRDDKTYAVTKIGNQCWMAENLAYTGNGCLVSEGTVWNDSTPFNACNVNGGAGWAQTEVLYQWGAAMNGSSTEGAQGLCPAGWHIPTDAEWTTLTNYVNSVSEYKCNDTNNWIGKALATTINWNTNGTECTVGNNLITNNATGFSGAPVGLRGGSGVLSEVGASGLWWSSSQSGSNVWRRSLDAWYRTFDRGTSGQSAGRSIRCIRGS